MIDPSSVPGYDVESIDGVRLGSHDWTHKPTELPLPGDHVRVFGRGDPRSALYRVVLREFEPDNVTVIVEPADEAPEAESTDSPFVSQPPGAGGFS